MPQDPSLKRVSLVIHHLVPDAQKIPLRRTNAIAACRLTTPILQTTLVQVRRKARARRVARANPSLRPMSGTGRLKMGGHCANPVSLTVRASMRESVRVPLRVNHPKAIQSGTRRKLR